MKKSRWWIWAFIAAILVIFHAQLLEFMARTLFLRETTSLAKADFLIVLQGDLVDRTEAVFEQYKNENANAILFVSTEILATEKAGLIPNSGDLTKTYLEKLGVPKDAMVFLSECHASSTKAEAECLKNYLLSLSPLPRRVTVVTSWNHSARAAWIFNRIFDKILIEIQWVPVAKHNDSPSTWWKHESSFFSTVSEAIKWPYYLFHYL